MDNANTAIIPALAPVPSTLFMPTPQAAKRVLEFFTAHINNDHTRKAYLNATRRFAEWCTAHGIGELAGVHPFQVAAFIKELQGQFSPPTVKQHLAALRMLFDWLVTGHVLDVNPAHAVRGPKYVVKKGKTPVLTAEEARDCSTASKSSRRRRIRMERNPRSRTWSACAIAPLSASWFTRLPAWAPCCR
jgi:site-specific recombinase XerD